jgi:hypothetical protein
MRKGDIMTNRLIVAATAALALTACSSKPRPFTPTLSAVPADQRAFDAAIAECGQLLADGKLNSNGRLASGAAGAAAGGATLAAGAAAASSAGLYGGMAVASATIVAIPFVALAGAWGMSKIKRKKKEKAIQLAMGGCLAERGYTVSGWAKTARIKPAAEAPAASN